MHLLPKKENDLMYLHVSLETPLLKTRGNWSLNEPLSRKQVKTLGLRKQLRVCFVDFSYK